jgi:hypothetical protein
MPSRSIERGQQLLRSAVVEMPERAAMPSSASSDNARPQHVGRDYRQALDSETLLRRTSQAPRSVSAKPACPSLMTNCTGSRASCGLNDARSARRSGTATPDRRHRNAADRLASLIERSPRAMSHEERDPVRRCECIRVACVVVMLVRDDDPA